jgi:hypothetical protein
VSRDELAIARTVMYAALFDYPLTLEQLHQSLIASSMTPEEILSTYCTSVRLRAIVEYRDGFFFPAGSAALILERRHREVRSLAFLSRHRRLLTWICAFPFTRMVALSGSIAHLNLEEGGDLDLFIVTRGRRVWTVTLAMILLTRLLGVRRVVCANFVMSDGHLAIDQQDLFTANQALHLRPLIGHEVLEGFLAANPFIQRYYPNRPSRGRREFALHLGPALRAVKTVLEFALSVPSPAIEKLCMAAYSWHLRRRAKSWQSPEQVQLSPDLLKLHTQSHRRSVLDRFDERMADTLGQEDHAAIA